MVLYGVGLLAQKEKMAMKSLVQLVKPVGLNHHTSLPEWIESMRSPGISLSHHLSALGLQKRLQSL